MSKKFEIKVQYRIEAARRLSYLPSSHPCSRVHGHGFAITLWIEGIWNEELAWLMDYNDIEKAVRPLLNTVDHQYLNDIPGLEKPTSETLCIYLFDRIKKIIPELQKISIAETPHTECSYSGD